MPLNTAPIPPILPGDSGLSVRVRLNDLMARFVAVAQQVNLIEDATTDPAVTLLTTRVEQLETDMAALVARMAAAESGLVAAGAVSTALDVRLTAAETAFVPRVTRHVVVASATYDVQPPDMDGDTVIVCTATSPVTVTVPVGLPTGSVSVWQEGTGAVTLAAGAGVVLHTATGLVLRNRYSAASIVRAAGGEVYFAAGDLT